MHYLSPDRVLQIGLGFWSSRTLMSALELGLFTELGKGPRSADQLCRSLGLEPLVAADFLDALLALGFVEREGDDAHAVYINTRESTHFLDRRSPTYVGGLLEASHGPLYGAWETLTQLLQQGRAQPLRPTAASNTPADVPFKAPVNAPRVETYRQEAIEGLAILHGEALAAQVDLTSRARWLDLHGATGRLVCAVVAQYPQLHALTVDHAGQIERARAHIEARSLSARVRAMALSPQDAPADPLALPWPEADAVTLSLVLREWAPAHRRALLNRAHRALGEGGCLFAIDHLIDDTRRRNAAGLMLSLSRQMVGDATSSLAAQALDSECRAAGFMRTELRPLVGGAVALVAWK